MSVISVFPSSASEFNSDPVFEVRLASQVAQTVTVQYRTIADGSAAAGTDYTERFGTLTFNPGETSKFVTITNRYNSENESDENFTFEVHSPTNATLSGGGLTLQATGVIEDSDNTPSADNDFALFVSDPKFLETDSTGQNAVFEIRLSEPAPSSLTLNYATADGTATAGSDYTATTGSVTFNTGEDVKFVSVPILGDVDVEATETFSLVVTPAGTLQNGTQDSTGIATIFADDTAQAGPVITVEPASSSEFDEDNNFLVTLSEESTQTVTVLYRTVADGSATAGEDFTEVLDTLTFLPGETAKVITVANRYSSSDESDENYSLEFFAPTNAALAGDGAAIKVTGVIEDSNGTANDLALFVSDPTFLETDTTGQLAVFEVQLSAPSTNTITVDYTTIDGSARAGTDYTATSGTLTFAPGQTIASVSVPIIGDTTVEGTEVFSLNLTPSGFVQNGVEDNTGVATIIEDDSATDLPVISIAPASASEFSDDPIFAVTLSEASTQTVTVDIRTIADGSALAGTDYNERFDTITFLPGETTQLFQVTTNYNSTDESDENYAVELHSPSNAVLAGDVETLKATGVIEDSNGAANDLALFVSDPVIREVLDAGTVARFEIRLSTPSDDDITMSYETLDGTATAGADYTATSGSILFVAGQTIGFVDVPILADANAEAMETFTLNVTPSGFVQNGTQDSGGIATILDQDPDDTRPIISVLPTESSEFDEDNNFIVSLSAPAVTTVTVSYRTVADGSALAGSDYDEAVGTLTFLPGETQKVVTVRTDYNSFDEADENYTFELHSAQNAILSGQTDTLQVQGVIRDSNGGANDLALFVSDPKVVETDGAGAMAVFQITLSEPSDNDIELTYATRDASAVAGEDYTATSGVVTMKAGQTVTSVAVPILGDVDAEVSEVFSLHVTANGFIQNGVQDNTGIATILDDDASVDVPIISILPAAAREFTEDPPFIISLSEASTQVVTVDYRTVADGSATSGTDFNAATGTITFQPGETTARLTITNRYNSTDESDENFSVELFSPTNAVLSGEQPTLKTTGVILDSNDQANNLALFVSDPQVVELDEDTNAVAFEIRLSEPSDNSIILTYATADGTATAGQDYEATSGSVTFVPGQTVGAVIVPVFGDFGSEGAETFTLNVTPNGFVQNGVEDNTGTATIIDNDIDLELAVADVTVREEPLRRTTMTFDITLGVAPVQTEVMNFTTVDGSATAGLDYLPVSGTLTFEPGETSKSVTVVVLNDRATEGTEAFTLEVTEDAGTDFEQTEVGVGRIDDFNFNAANTINGNQSANDIVAGGGNDTVSGFGGADDIFGGSGADRIFGGGGSDKIKGGDQGDNIFGGGGGDSISGGKGGDMIDGSTGRDDLFGDAGRDKIYGGSDLDDLYGGTGGDSLFGGGGRDSLFGGKGQDQLTGGGSADRFIFTEPADTGATARTRDVITDFSARQGDRIDLRQIDAKTGNGNDAFKFIGEKDFTGNKGQLQIIDTGANILVRADRDGDGKHDLAIMVRGVNGLDAGDFIL